ncbi:hypothetical protein ABEP42_27155 [Priestia megaterium]|uniref:hypothetical protein n=1 Tax=Priestia megaterium TaxID=1404 RepID=UPI0031827D88
MSNYQKMKESLTKMEEVRSSIVPTLTGMRALFNDETLAIKQNADLSPQGKQKKMTEVKEQLGKDFMTLAKQLKDDYRKASTSAKVAAEMLLNEKPKKPSTNTTIQTFERQFNDLKMKLMLETRANYSIDHLNKFIAEQKDPYFAQSIIDEFPSIVQTVLGTAGPDSAKYKVELSKALDNAKQVAITPEQREAEAIYSAMDAEYDRDLFGRGIEMDTVTDLFGTKIAGHVNKPDSYIVE